MNRRLTSLCAALLTCACAPSSRPAPLNAPSVEESSHVSSEPESAACSPSPEACAAALGWVDCDDCDTDELATRDGPAALVDCLTDALRCGPDHARQRQYASHGRLEEWSDRFRVRAALGLAGLAPLGTDALVRSRAWNLPASAVAVVDRELGGPNGLVPPAGMSPCEAAPAISTPVAAALACFRDRLRPALMALGAREAHYRFGRGDYLRTTYQLEPVTVIASRGWPEIERELGRHPPTMLAQVTLLGGMARVDSARRWDVVEMTLRHERMPADGGVLLIFVIDANTRATVLVYRVALG